MRWLESLFGRPKTRLRSSVCRQADFGTPWYKAWTARIAAGADPLPAELEPVWGAVWEGMQGRWLHRKLWEWAAISQALDERGMLADGTRGIGFAVGSEPLASLFASRGAAIVATDYLADDDGWAETGQNAKSLDAIHWPKLIDARTFEKNVSFENQDMRNLKDLKPGSFDFAWSSCALEHLGSLEAGTDFIHESVALLKPGGIAVHTTEFNVSSNVDTLTSGSNVIYRRMDIEKLQADLEANGHHLEEPDYHTGLDEHDVNYDRPPFYRGGYQHVKLLLEDYVSTSMILIVRRGG